VAAVRTEDCHWGLPASGQKLTEASECPPGLGALGLPVGVFPLIGWVKLTRARYSRGVQPGGSPDGGRWRWL